MSSQNRALEKGVSRSGAFQAHPLLPSTPSSCPITAPAGAPTLLSTSSCYKYLQWVQLKWSRWYQLFLNMRGCSLMTRWHC